MKNRLIPIVFVLIWSTGFIVARYGMPWSEPMHFLSARFAFSLVGFMGLAWWFRASWPSSWQQVGHLMVVGLLMQAGYLGGVWTAVKWGMGAAVSALIVGLQPLLTAWWLHWTAKPHEPRLTLKQWMGLWLGLLGCCMVLWHKLIQTNATDTLSWFNLTCAVVALLAITTGTLYQKRFVATTDVRTASIIQMAAALLVVVPLAFGIEHEPMIWNGQLIGALVWSVVGLTLGASSLLFLLIARGAATQVTSLMYLVPPTTALLAWWLFGETLTILSLLGMACTAWGVGWVMAAPSIKTPKNS